MAYSTYAARRIPIYGHAEVRSRSFGGRASTVNLGPGGVQLRIPVSTLGETDPRSLAGTAMSVTLRLPDTDKPAALQSQVIWSGDVAMDATGRAAVPVGVQFVNNGDATMQRVRTVVSLFRYEVLVVGDANLSLASEAFDGLYQVRHIPTWDAKQVSPEVDTHITGLVIVAPGGSTALATVLSEAPEVLPHHPTVLVLGTELSEDEKRRISQTSRVLYVQTPVTPLELRTLGRQSVEDHALAVENRHLRDELAGVISRLERENTQYKAQIQATPVQGLVGNSDLMQALYSDIERLARYDVGVLLHGETGTGKTMVARAIHDLSDRADKPFLSLNCAAISETLLDSELFGHSKGAFTGATNRRPGLFEAGDQGTVFLDEIAEMSPGMQAKLLDVLETGTVRRVGESQSFKVNVRLLCATHRDLDDLVKQSAFRDDLYYRLSSFVLYLPALRERAKDIPALAQHFLKEACKRFERSLLSITEEAVMLLERFPWPGNVRQLRQVVERLVIVTPNSGRIDSQTTRRVLEMASPHQASQIADNGNGDGMVLPDGIISAEQLNLSLNDAVADFEKTRITRALRENGGVMARAARELQIDRTTLTRRCQRFGIDPKHVN